MSFCCKTNVQGERRVHPLGRPITLQHASHIEGEERKSGGFRLNFPFKLVEKCPHDIILRSPVGPPVIQLVRYITLSAEQHWACSQTSVGITCKCLGRSVEPERRKLTALSNNQYTAVPPWWHTHSCTPPLPRGVPPLKLPSGLVEVVDSPPPKGPRCTCQLFQEFS